MDFWLAFGPDSGFSVGRFEAVKGVFQAFWLVVSAAFLALERAVFRGRWGLG